MTPATGPPPDRSDNLAHGGVAVGVPLSALMGDLRAVDASRLSGVSQSTLSRLWGNPQWIQRVEGDTLSKLMAVSPSVGAYVSRWGENQRLDAAARCAEAVGADLRHGAFTELVHTAPASTVIALLSAVTEMMQGRHDNASRMFASSWGQRNNGVADAFFESGSAGIFEDMGTILKSAEEFVLNPPGFADVTKIVGYGIVEHKLIRTGANQRLRVLKDQKDTLAFLTRSSTIARILSGDDLAFVEWYRDRVFTRHDLVAMELWSHATYSQDIPMSQRRLPKTTRLAATAAMTVADMYAQNDAYVYYLLVVALPLFLRMDPRLTEHYPALLSALETVAEERAEDCIRAAARTLLVQLNAERAVY